MIDGCNDEEFIRISMYLPEKINRCINILAEDYLKDTQLKVYYVPYISHIYNVDGITQKELKALIPFDKSRISVVVHELIDKGLVYDDKVGRTSCLHLTEEGRSAYPLCKMFNDLVKKEVFGMNETHEAFFKEATQKLNSRLDSIIEKHSH